MMSYYQNGTPAPGGYGPPQPGPPGGFPPQTSQPNHNQHQQFHPPQGIPGQQNQQQHFGPPKSMPQDNSRFMQQQSAPQQQMYQQPQKPPQQQFQPPQGPPRMNLPPQNSASPQPSGPMPPTSRPGPPNQGFMPPPSSGQGPGMGGGPPGPPGHRSSPAPPGSPGFQRPPGPQAHPPQPGPPGQSQQGQNGPPGPPGNFGPPSNQPGQPPAPQSMRPPQPPMGGGPPQPQGPQGPPTSHQNPMMGGMPPMPGGGGMPPMPPGGGMPPRPQMGMQQQQQQFGGGPPQGGNMPPGMGPPQPGMPPHPGSMGPPGPQPGMGGPPGMPGQFPGQQGQPQHFPPGPPGGFQGQSGPMGGQQAPQKRLDPSAMPSAIQVMEDDMQAKSGAFQTGYPVAEIPPLVTTQFFSEDQGNCNPKFMRATIYCAPANQDLLKTSAVPFGVSVSPFAEQHPNEHPPPIVNLGELGPVRCNRCKAYICPFMEFQDGGRRFCCPFCKTSTEVPTEYFAHLDHQGRRTDLYERPELYCGSYEFVATKEYCKKSVQPKPPAFIFMLDVSYNSIRNGVVSLFCRNIKQLLRNLPKDYGQEESSMQVGFATYDQTVHFYNLKSSLDQPQMMIVGDIQDMFVPIVNGFLVSPSEAEVAIDNLLMEIPAMFGESRITEIVLGPAIQAGLDALKASDRVGKLFVFHSSLPVLEAPGKLKNREDRKLLGTEKEKTVLTPVDEFYSNLAQECVGVGCSVDMFLFPNSFIDVATIGNLCGYTGGQCFKYQYFQAETDGERFLSDLKHDIERKIAFDAIMRIRTSTGIRPTDFFGSFYMSNTTDVELASIDSDKAITVEIRHDDKIDPPAAYIQAAVLYTSVGGQRRLRIHNLALQTADNYQNLFRFADLDTTVNFLTKFAQRMQLRKNPKEVREYLVGRTAQILASYREKCSESAPMGQLILPECMKLLPLYINCIVRNDAFSGGSELTVDDKAWLIQSIPSLRVADSVRFLYPRMLSILDLPQEAADTDDWDLPAGVRCSYENVQNEGVYLLENGITMFLWIGIGAPMDWMNDVFNCGVIGQIDTEKNTIPVNDNANSKALRRVIRRLQMNRPRQMKLFIIRQQDKLEPWFKKFLVEDRGADSSPSYVDFLCAVHREIRNLLS